MFRTPYPGAYFVDSLPTGERVVMYQGSHFTTHAGRVDFPPGESFGLMFVTCTNVPEFQFAGLGHDANGTMWEWNFSKGWHQVPFVTGRAVYDWNGTLRDVQPAGYQFVSDSGEPITRLEAYGPKNGLSEWSETGGLQIGQGHATGGVVIWDGQHLRELDKGNCVFIRVHRSWENVAINYVKSGEGAIIVQATLTELRALPLLTIEPDEPAEPDEEPVTFPIPPRVKAIVQAIYERNIALAEGDDDQRRALILTVAQQCAFELGPMWGTKRAGEGRPPSKDAIAHYDGATLYGADCFNGTTRQPAVPDEMEALPGQLFISVDPVNHLGPQPPPPDDGDLPKLREEFTTFRNAMYADLASVRARLDESRRTADSDRQQLVALAERVENLKPTGGRVKGRTKPAGSSFLSHSHEIDLSVE